MNMKTGFRLGMGVCLVVGLGACSNMLGKDELLFDGVEMRYKSRHVDKDDRTLFTVEAWPVSATLQGARLAARHAGIEYCVGNFGTSTIKWEQDPLAEDVAPYLDGDRLHARGQCRP